MFFAPRLAVAGLALGLSGLLVAPVQAASMAEYFNDYGETNIAVDGLNGGSGWDGAWFQADAGKSSIPQYVAGESLTSSVTGYENTGNLTGENHGWISQSLNTVLIPNDHYVARSTGGLTGTIWMSALFQVEALARGVRFAFDSDDASADTWVELKVGNSSNPPISASYGGAETSVSVGDYGAMPALTTHILMVRIGINEDGDNDSFDVWIRPNDVTSEIALGTPDFSFSGEDVFGDSLDFISVSLSTDSTRTTRVDAIRLSNDDHAFEFVTTGVPEPATMMLLGLGAALMASRSRRRTAA